MTLNHPVYRATQTMRFMGCQVSWYREQAGWRDPYIGVKDSAACLGTAFHAAAALLMLAQEAPEPAIEAGRQALEQGIDDLYFSGRLVKPEVQAELAALPARFTNATKYLANNLSLLAAYEVVATELTLPDAGHTTIDLVLRDKRTGLLSILDWKCKTFSRPYYRDQYITDMAQSWQLRHYVWGYGVQTGEHPVSYIVGLVDVTGKVKIDLLEYDVYDEEMGRWYAEARQVWEDMSAVERGERVPVRCVDPRTRFGVCESCSRPFIRE